MYGNTIQYLASPVKIGHDFPKLISAFCHKETMKTVQFEQTGRLTVSIGKDVSLNTSDIH